MTVEENMAKYQDELKGLGDRINKANEYFQIERRMNELIKEQQIIEQNLTTLERELQGQKRALSRYEDEKELITDRMNDYRQEKVVIQSNPIYKKVKDFQAIFTDEPKAVIMDRRHQLELEIHGIQQSYSKIVTEIEHGKKDIQRMEAEINDLLQFYDEIDKEMEFPVDGVRLLERTQKDVQSGKIEVDKLDNIQTEAREALIEQQARVRTQEDRFKQDFSDAPLYEFDLPLDDIEESLRKEKQKLVERETYLQAETERLKKEYNDLMAATQELDKFEIAHHFKSTIITSIPLTEKELTDFTYNRKEFVRALTNELTFKQEERKEGQEKINRAKQDFRLFCRDKITERKLREMATEGIEYQRSE